MSVNVALQVPGSLVDIGLDWADALAEIAEDETIVASEWELVYGSIEANVSGSQVGDLPGVEFDDTQTAIWIKGGEEGSTSRLRNIVTTSGGRELAETVIVKVASLLNPAVEVPASRTFRLLPTAADGLLGELEKSIAVGTPTTIAVEFAEDLPLHGRVKEIVSVTVVSGPGGGFDVLSMRGRRSQAVLKVDPLAAGDYVVKTRVRYERPTGDEDEATGKITLHLVA